MPSSQAQSSPKPTFDIYEQVDKYPWDTDAEFQGGLLAILGSNPTPSQTAELTIRARCFYYQRKFKEHVDFDTYKTWREARNLPSPLPPTPQPQQQTNGGIGTDIPSSPASTTLPPWTAPSAQVATSAAEADSGPRLSYQEIVDMIQTGKAVPGIKDIPATVLEGQGTQASVPRRKKPWEKNEDIGAAQEEGNFLYAVQ